jgi:hypothetical protein
MGKCCAVTWLTAIQQISYWCSITGHEYFTEVPEAFIEDAFNLTGLAGQVPFYNEALSMILDGDYGLTSMLCKALTAQKTNIEDSLQTFRS